jgi:hypothetical protein
MLAYPPVVAEPLRPTLGAFWAFNSRRRAWHLLRGALPAVTTATLIPLALFYSLSAVAGMKVGIVASLTWAYLVLGRQLLTSRRISGLIIITAVTLTVRCVTWTFHQSTFTYFAVPIATTTAVSTLFVVSLAFGRPLLVSLARDFMPAVGDGLSHASHRRLVRHLSCLWGLIYLGNAASSATLLSTQSVHWYLLLHQLSGWLWTGTGLAISFTYTSRQAKGLFALPSDLSSRARLGPAERALGLSVAGIGDVPARVDAGTARGLGLVDVPPRLEIAALA